MQVDALLIYEITCFSFVASTLFLLPNVRTIMPPNNNNTPTQDNGANRSPTIITLNNAAVKGSANDKVTAEDDGIC